MNLGELLKKYKEHPRLFYLADRLSFADTQKIFLKNLQGSSAEFVLAALFDKYQADKNSNPATHLIVLNDAEEAAYFHNTLENLTQALNLFYFPSSFKSKKDYHHLNSSHVMLRTETLTKLSVASAGIIVTYPEALFEKVVLPDTLSSNIIHIKTNDTLNLESLLELFVMYGFERTDFVYEPGQFALRGGILDIYSFGNEKPYRVELFGNDVDSIRIFDPESQLSERKLLQVSIIPNIETQFESDEKISLLDFLPEQTVVWIKDWDVAKETINEQEEYLGDYIEHNKNSVSSDEPVDDDTTVLKTLRLKDFVPASTLERQINNHHLVEFGYKPHLSNFEIELNTKPQPAFNRQFDLLIKDLKAHESKGYELYIFAEQAKQLERLNTIFNDLNTEIQFTPIATSIHEGFIDEDLKVVCYTDHQIFQRYHKYRVKQAYNKNKALTLRTLRELQPGDFVTHIDHGVGTYSGLQKLEVNGKLQEAVRIIYKDGDILYVNINSLHKISKFTGKKELHQK
jgi:transcription-repair coupling factor (superfamily II helicase)